MSISQVVTSSLRIIAWSVLAFLACSRMAPATELGTLTRVEQIRKLSVEEANRSHPVRLVGVVTYFDGVSPNVFLQDATGGIWARWPKDGPRLRAGQRIQLEGVTKQPGFAPSVYSPRAKVLGKLRCPRRGECRLSRWPPRRRTAGWWKSKESYNPRQSQSMDARFF